ncbi:uncharacterized protein TRIADDRAFT_4447, partial [Trichoplax adhaerens]
LVCHDMKNGYHEDRFAQGCGDNDAFTFYHWQYIDIFIYFSHHLLSIPPSTWINCAHKHQVLVLGTFITEWDEGNEICREFLSNAQLRHLLINRLVDIAHYYRFDGWLINIENNIEKKYIMTLVQFVAELTNKLHQKIPHGQILWYDSVTNTGDLKWQNELNMYNRTFFDSCDGIFLNYVWKPGNLLRSVLNAGQERKHDVYAGIDIFGRGCYKGGGFKSRDALEVIRESSLSAALFAPGWVYE